MSDIDSLVANDDRLDSWKAIANYLGRSVRTAKRWELEEGLPVHRHMHLRKGTVHAFRGEIDRWRGQRNHAPAPADACEQNPGLLVLPFEHIGPSNGQGWIAAGVADALIERLSRVRGLRVLSRTSDGLLRAQSENVRAISRRHGVGHFIEGTTRGDGRRIRVAIRLIDVSRDTAIWSEGFDGQTARALDLQNTIAERVADELSGVLGQSLSPDDELPDGPSSTAEWKCLVLARQDALKWRRDGLEAALQRLNQGIDSLGRRPMLVAALGRTWLQFREGGLDFGSGPLRRARACADELSDRGIQHPSRLLLDGWIRYAEGNVAGAIRALQRAETLMPNDPETMSLLINCLLISDRGAEAEPRIQRLCSIDPLTPLTVCMPGWQHLLRGEFDAAVPHYRRMYDLDPANSMALAFLTWTLALAGHTSALEELFESGSSPQQGTPESDPVIGVTRFLAAATLGRNDAQRWLDSSIESVAEANDILPRFLADGFAQLGDADSAVKWLRIAVDRGFIHYPFLADRNRLLRSIDQNPGFQELLDEVRRHWQQRLIV